ncbi:metal-dependent hydrolase [Lachnospiraceae bacterium JLR.KK008]
MMAASHRLGGVAAGMLTAGILTSPDDVAGKAVLLSAAVLGSLIPDIDHPRSSISRRHRGISVAVGIFQTLLRGLGNLLPRRQEQYVRGAAGHRGASHSLFMAVLCTLLVSAGAIALPAWKETVFLASWGVGVGVLSHLFLDMLAGGVSLLFPFTMKRITLARIRTGGPLEWMVRMLMAGALILLAGNELLRWR